MGRTRLDLQSTDKIPEPGAGALHHGMSPPVQSAGAVHHGISLPVQSACAIQQCQNLEKMWASLFTYSSFA